MSSSDERRDQYLRELHEELVKQIETTDAMKPRLSRGYIARQIKVPPDLFSRVVNATPGSAYFPNSQRPKCANVVEKGVDFLRAEIAAQNVRCVLKHETGELAIRTPQPGELPEVTAALVLIHHLLSNWIEFGKPPLFGYLFDGILGICRCAKAPLQSRLAHDILGSLVALVDKRKAPPSSELEYVGKSKAREVLSVVEALEEVCPSRKCDPVRNKQARSYAGFCRFFLGVHLEDRTICDAGWSGFIEAAALPTPVEGVAGFSVNAGTMIEFVRTSDAQRAKAMRNEFEAAMRNGSK